MRQREVQERTAPIENYFCTKNKGDPIKDFYDIFCRNCSNLRRKLAKNNTAREKFDTEFKKIRTEALKMKNGLFADSPKQSIYEYFGFLRVKEDELRELANRLTTDTI